jgi:hypothetical protein
LNQSLANDAQASDGKSGKGTQKTRQTRVQFEILKPDYDWKIIREMRDCVQKHIAKKRAHIARKAVCAENYARGKVI